METMKAAVLEGLKQWSYQDFSRPTCGAKEVIIQVMRASICSTDVVRSMETGFYHYPIIPGHEFCGIISEIGSDVKNVRIGDRVAVYPLIACKKCLACRKGHPNLCNSYNFLGSRTHGGYAE